MKNLSDPAKAFDTVLGLITRLAQHGLIHCDFNEFNLMVCICVSWTLARSLSLKKFVFFIKF